MSLNELSKEIFSNNYNVGWWQPTIDVRKMTKTEREEVFSFMTKSFGEERANELFGHLNRNKAELLMLMVSELAEAMEGVRKGLQDDHLPHRTMEEVELADTIIRISDYCGAFGIDLDGAIRDKLEYNKQRADHKLSNREKEGGKKF